MFGSDLKVIILTKETIISTFFRTKKILIILSVFNKKITFLTKILFFERKLL